MKPELSRLTNTTRLQAEARGRRSAQAAFDRVAAHGYRTTDDAFQEIGATLLEKWAREEGMTRESGEVWLASARAKFDALVAEQRRNTRVEAPTTDVFARLRDKISGMTRKFGFTIAPAKLSSKHWQQVLAAVEGQMHTQGVALPDGWRDELAKQMGRSDLDPHAGPER